jgi:paraquat-inducible protein A
MIFWESEYSVLTGIAGLWDDGQHILAVVILFFSVLFPVAKLGLLWCVWTLRYSTEQRTLVIVWLERLGKWSMLDVFAVAILVVAAKLGAAADVRPRPGVYVFGAAVVLSMIATGLTERLAKHRAPRAKT